MSKLFALFQYLLPQHLLSRFVGVFAERKFAKNILIRLFIQKYRVDMSEAACDVADEYPNFNAFFTRKLKASARPINSSPNIIVSPADGRLVASGRIKDSQLIQAKSRHFCTQDLLGGDNTLARTFDNGDFITVYLSPRDYHRVHMPLNGRLLRTIHIPGRLFSVGNATSLHIPNLFARNERLVCVFETKAGLCCLILVGAMIVSSIETVWSSEPSRNTSKINEVDYTLDKMPVTLEKGAEAGRFKLGSTVIVLFEASSVILDSDIIANQPIKMGESLGHIVKCE